MDLSGRYRAGVRTRDGWLAGRAGERTDRIAVRLPPDTGAGTQEGRRVERTPAHGRTSDHPRSQAGRGDRGLAAPAA